MSTSLTLIARDAEAERILAAFEERTGLHGDRDGERVVFGLETAHDHQVRIIEVLTEIDEHWPAHLALGQPA